MWTSLYAPLPAVPPLLLESLEWHAARNGSRAALVDATDGTRVTRRELVARTARAAGALRARGFGPTDVLALWAPNSPDWAVVALGAMAAGGAVAGISPVATDGELAVLLRRTRGSVLAADPALFPRARALGSAAGVRETITLGEAAHPTAPPSSTEPIPADATALLPGSSGTTGPPKSVVLTHANLAAGLGQLQAGISFTEDDVVLALAPFPHVLGFVVTLAGPLAAGATVVTMPRFDLGALLDAIETHRVTVLAVPPPVLAALTSPLAAMRDLASLQFVAAGGAPVSPALQARTAARFPRAVIGQGYGMTETTAVIPVPDRVRGTAPGTVGRLGPGTEARIVDPADGRDLGPEKDGELWVRGPQVTPGYLADPAADAELFSADGWLRTGDLARFDRTGELRIVDRLKELIKVDALQVAPAELEALLMSHPAVADAAVVGRTDERHGEVPVASVVPRGDVDPDALIAWAAERVSPHKRLREVTLVGQIPRTPSGKVLRRLLRTDAVGPVKSSVPAGVSSRSVGG
jgi:acyl-CoA synthetase (AMP-forming)/AMP-acid ligase II